MPRAVPERATDDDADHADDERDAGAVDAAGEHVAADAVTAEPEVPARAEGVVAGAVDAPLGQADERQVVGEDGEEEEEGQPADAEPQAERPLAPARGIDDRRRASTVALVVAAGARSLMVPVASTDRAGEADARVDDRVEQVDDEVAHDDGDHEDGPGRLDDQQVVLLDGDQQPVADALRAEELLDDDGAADQGRRSAGRRWSST